MILKHLRVSHHGPVALDTMNYWTGQISVVRRAGQLQNKFHKSKHRVQFVYYSSKDKSIHWTSCFTYYLCVIYFTLNE